MMSAPGPVRGPTARRLWRLATGLVVSLSRRMGALSVRYPTLSLQDRLTQFKALNLDWQPGTQVHFNDHFVPYIVAASDAQAAYALGCVAEFQRGTQLQFLLRLAKGRLSELGGARFVDMDHLVRLLDFGHAADAIWAAMPASTQTWVSEFVRGLNAVQAQRPRGVDEKLMGMQPEPYTHRDVLLLGRLAGADVNWPIYFSLIEHHLHGDWLHWWGVIRRSGVGVLSSFGGQRDQEAQALAQWLGGLGRSGSNSMAVAAHRSQSGAPLLVNDPHLGMHLPNVWMMVGIHSPSYQCVGLMFPGVPVLGLGRNPTLAWGGTNLRAASSDLVQLNPQSLSTQQQTSIRVRWGFARKRVLEWSTHGPVLTSCPALGRFWQGQRLALRWAGHWATDEISSFLEGMRASNVRELHAAMDGVGVTPLNVLGADAEGHIGHVLAATLPKRSGFPDQHWMLDEATANQQWSQRVSASQLPAVMDPPEGFLVSANNRPSPDALVGFLFNGDDRVMRARQLLSNSPPLSLQQLQHLQLDVTSPLAQGLAQRLARLCLPHAHTTAHRSLCHSLAQWTGQYSADSLQALQFECVLSALVQHLVHHRQYGTTPNLMEQWGYLVDGLLPDLQAVGEPLLGQWVPECLEWADKKAQHWQMWGQVHKVRLRHVLGHSRLLGKLFSSRSFAASGSRETLMKNAHNTVHGYDECSYGSQSRHASDLADLDANYFVLLGGQDGWVGSQLMTDQMALWQTAQTIQMPLRLSSVERMFAHRLVEPALPPDWT